jgi:hypothetical protein
MEVRTLGKGAFLFLTLILFTKTTTTVPILKYKLFEPDTHTYKLARTVSMQEVKNEIANGNENCDSPDWFVRGEK